MSLAGIHERGFRTRFPRVSGDEPWDTIWQGISTVFSPRERG